jgi:tRNA (guanine37-N1)-methyltransferase
MTRGKLIKELARKLYGEEIARKLWGRVEVIGDIAVIRKPPDIPVDMLKQLAEELLKNLRYVKSVWASVSSVGGMYRTRDYVHLAGECRSTTIYREHGCSFYIDITKVYISPALNYEHLRIAKNVKDGEYVINMFAGAGLFSIIIAKHAKPSKVVSIDINPYAYEFMVKNVKLNNVEGVVEPILGDAGVVIENYINTADRILMPLPELAYSYFEKAVKALRNRGVIHVYEFVRGSSRESVINEVISKYLSKCDELRY